MKSASFLRKPLPHVDMADADHLAADIIRMEQAGTWNALDSVCRTIEARHAVEGISEHDRRVYNFVKQAQVTRVAVTYPS